jgi:hypothetical protein
MRKTLGLHTWLPEILQQPRARDMGLMQGVRNLMAENVGLGIDKQSHPDPLMLTELLRTCSRLWLI